MKGTCIAAGILGLVIGMNSAFDMANRACQALFHDNEKTVGQTIQTSKNDKAGQMAGHVYAAGSTDPLKEAKEHYYNAIKYHLRQDYNNALAEYLMAAYLEPDHPAIAYQMGQTYFSQGKTDEAVMMFEKAVILDQKYPDPHFMLGKTHMQQKNYEKAISEIDKYLELDPDTNYKWEAANIRAECERLLIQR